MRCFWILMSCFALLSQACDGPLDREFLEVREVEHPSTSGGQPFLIIGEDGILYSSWLEYLNDSLVALNFSAFHNRVWSLPEVIAQGENWFVNWADFPSISANKEWMAAHWLQYRGAGVYEYDVQIALKKSGLSWSKPITPHSDGVAAEHGFASMTPIDQDHMLAVWLDGRNTISSGSDPKEHAHGNGAMTLRSAMIDQNGHLSQEIELDDRVCDCCQTDIVMTEKGPLVVYRNRTEDEIRDIYVVRSLNGKWQEPHPIYIDGWKIGGCPVNGPAVDASGELIAVAWFTMAKDSARVKLSFSQDGGDNFDRPLILSDADPLGRVDLSFIDEKHVLITWLENRNRDEAEILGCVVSKDLSRSEIFKLVSTSPARKSGFPKIAVVNNDVYLSWTEIQGSDSRVKTAQVIFE